jgi:hypothetical protein
MAYYYYSEAITGSANATVYGNGITSTEAEKKHLVELWVVVSGRQGNFVEGWIEREKLVSVIDQVLSLPADAYRVVISVDVDIDIGRTFKAALRCGGTATNIYVTYVYTLV